MTSADEIRIRLRSPGDLAAAVPHLVGFHPHDSLVVLAVHAAPSRIGLTMRYDLPPEADDGRLAAEIAGRVVHDDAVAAVVFCFPPEPVRAGDLPRRDLVDAIDLELLAAGIELHDAMCICDERFWSYLCRDPRCCPPEGQPVPDADDVVAARAMFGRATLPDRAALVDSVAPRRPLSRRSIERACRRADRAGARRRTADLVDELVARFADPRSASLTDDEAASVVIGLLDVRARDAVLGGLDGLREAGPHELGAHLALFTELVRRAPEPVAAPVATMLAAVAYQLGNGALANVALDRAEQSDSDYTLALLLREALLCQVPPEEIRRAWRPTVD